MKDECLFHAKFISLCDFTLYRILIPQVSLFKKPRYHCFALERLRMKYLFASSIVGQLNHLFSVGCSDQAAQSKWFAGEPGVSCGSIDAEPAPPS